jgi:hypothetical protein
MSPKKYNYGTCHCEKQDFHIEGANMKLVGLVFLGFVVSIAVLLVLCMSIAKTFRDIGDAGMPMSALAFIPLSFLIGSFVTGYFSCHDIENKWSLLVMAPALYFILLWICAAFLSNASTGAKTGNLLIPIAVALYWYLASLAGVFLGYSFRERFVKWWYRD